MYVYAEAIVNPYISSGIAEPRTPDPDSGAAVSACTLSP